MPAKDGAPIGPFNRHNFFTDSLMPLIGGAIFFACLPFVGLQIVITTTWGGMYKLGLPLPSMPHFGASLAKKPQDGHLLPWTVMMGGALPALWLYLGTTFPVTWQLILAYNVLRIGPMYTNFAHVYTLCHMETHRKYQMFGGGGHDFWAPWSMVWNGWIGLFHGVLPGTFTHSHLLNHHRYNNDVYDQYSTGGYRRDSFMSLMRYQVVWFAYALNLSTFYDLARRGLWAALLQTLALTGYYVGFLYAAVALTSPAYVLGTLGYALVEGNILLSVVNYTWHMFLEVRP